MYGNNNEVVFFFFLHLPYPPLMANYKITNLENLSKMNMYGFMKTNKQIKLKGADFEISPFFECH